MWPLIAAGNVRENGRPLILLITEASPFLLPSRRDHALPLAAPERQRRTSDSFLLLYCNFDQFCLLLLLAVRNISHTTDPLMVPVQLRVMQQYVSRLDLKEVMNESTFVGTYESKLATCIFSELCKKHTENTFEQFL